MARCHGNQVTMHSLKAPSLRQFKLAQEYKLSPFGLNECVLIGKKLRPRSHFWQKSLKITCVFEMLLMGQCLLRAISAIAKIFVLISHLQRLLSMFERMSIFSDRKMSVISAPNEIFFQACYKL